MLLLLHLLPLLLVSTHPHLLSHSKPTNKSATPLSLTPAASLFSGALSNTHLSLPFLARSFSSVSVYRIVVVLTYSAVLFLRVSASVGAPAEGASFVARELDCVSASKRRCKTLCIFLCGNRTCLSLSTSAQHLFN